VTPDQDRALYHTIILGDLKTVRDALYNLEAKLKHVPSEEELSASHLGRPNIRPIIPEKYQKLNMEEAFSAMKRDGVKLEFGPVEQERLIDPIEVTKVTIDLSNGCRMNFWPRSGPPRGGVIPEHWAFMAGLTPPDEVEREQTSKD